MDLGTVVVLVILGAIIFYVISIYNRLVSLRNRYQNAFAQIEVQLKRRYDLIPNLVETAKAYLSHERETLEKVTEARNQALGSLKGAAQNPGDPAAIGALASAESQLSASLGRFNVAVEAYPVLKANSNMM